MIRFFETGIIFVYFVPEEEIKSLIENDHIPSSGNFGQPDNFGRSVIAIFKML